jgi:manganese transport protein
VAGAALGIELPRAWLTAAVGALAFVLLWLGSTRSVSRILGCLVAFMGLAFVVTAVRLQPAPLELIRGGLLPRLPEGSSLLAIGLVGTTVVPYNLFLGSGIARGQKLGDLRFGLGVAIVLGGLISMGVLVVGMAVEPPLEFAALAAALGARVGGWAELAFAFGLLGAGLSSAITAPLAAAVTARSLFENGGAGRDEGRTSWGERSWRYRGVWLLVLLTGIGFGLAEVRPIPAIILAQALNGLLLPFVAVFLLLVVNDARLMGRAGLNGLVSNSAMCVVVAVTVLLGSLNATRAVVSATGLTMPGEGRMLTFAAGLVLVLAVPVGRALRARRAPLGVD